MRYIEGNGRRFRRRIIALIGIIVVLCIIGFAGDFLDVNQTPVKSDAIVVLGGGPMQRIAKGLQLYHAGYAPTLVLSGGNLFTQGKTESQMMAFMVEQDGVSKKNIVLESRSTSTYQNALFTKKILVADDMKSAIIVSSNYHMRRVQLLFGWVYRGTGIRLTYTAAPDWAFHPSHWWSNRESIRTTISEYGKIAAALVGIE